MEEQEDEKPKLTRGAILKRLSEAKPRSTHLTYRASDLKVKPATPELCFLLQCFKPGCAMSSRWCILFMSFRARCTPCHDPTNRSFEEK